MANEVVDLNSRKLKYLYIVCTVVAFAFVLYLYLPYNGHVVKNPRNARIMNGSSLNDKSVKLENLQNSHMQENQINAAILDLGINGTAQFKGILMEHVNLNYTRNIYITIKTTNHNYINRLPLLMMTWLQTVDKDKISIITDRSPAKQVAVDNIRKAGFHIVDTNCSENHRRPSLFCKTSYELDAYYKAVEAHPDEIDNYQWFCHFDDDVYVNILQLSRLLKRYDCHKPYYVGKWPANKRHGALNVRINDKRIRLLQNMKYDVKKKSFRYATGAGYCISYTLMMEAKKFFSGPATFQTTAAEVSSYSDDITIAFVIGVLLGYNLTNAFFMTNQYDHFVQHSALKKIIKYVTVGYLLERSKDLEKLSVSLKTPLPVEDKTKFMLYHCLLYPTVSWCHGVKEIYKTLNL